MHVLLYYWTPNAITQAVQGAPVDEKRGVNDCDPNDITCLQG